LEFASEVSDAIAARCTEVDSGARNIDYILGKSLTPALADVVLAAMAQGQNLSALRVGMGEEGAWKIEPEYDEESVAESGDGMADQEATSRANAATTIVWNAKPWNTSCPTRRCW